jgi:hypothetical protein
LTVERLHGVLVVGGHEDHRRGVIGSFQKPPRHLEPGEPGIWMSRNTTSGSSSSDATRASGPLVAWPTISMSSAWLSW